MFGNPQETLNTWRQMSDFNNNVQRDTSNTKSAVGGAAVLTDLITSVVNGAIQFGLQNQQNEYNSPASQMARYRAAGINPNAVMGSIDNGNQAQTPNIAMTNPYAAGLNAEVQAQQLTQLEAQTNSQLLQNEYIKEKIIEQRNVNGDYSTFSDLKRQDIMQGIAQKELNRLLTSGKISYQDYATLKAKFESMITEFQAQGTINGKRITDLSAEDINYLTRYCPTLASLIMDWNKDAREERQTMVSEGNLKLGNAKLDLEKRKWNDTATMRQLKETMQEFENNYVRQHGYQMPVDETEFERSLKKAGLTAKTSGDAANFLLKLVEFIFKVL